MNLGEKIRELRKKQHLTQEELAVQLGLQKSAIAKYENGRVTNIKRSTLLSMARILEASPTDLLCFPEASQGKDSGLAKLTGYYRQLNDFGKHKALDNLYDLTMIPSYCCAGQAELMPIAAHNDDALDPEQQRLMQEDIDEL